MESSVFRLKKRQSFSFMATKPCRVTFTRVGGGTYQVVADDPVTVKTEAAAEVPPKKTKP